MKNFINNKDESIYSNVEGELEGTLREDESLEDFNGSRLKDFTPTTDKDLQTIIIDVNKKEFEQDPVPLKVLVQCIDELKPILLFIVNDSLKRGVLPSLLKNALVRPAIKDSSGYKNNFKNTDLLLLAIPVSFKRS